ncbi:MAG: hypothetical protein JWM47_4165, partial [Acidimicrobiales bacterium]|nr:hypothetical protein [Acidimicrobiales bacterium]
MRVTMMRELRGLQKLLSYHDARATIVTMMRKLRGLQKLLSYHDARAT